MSKFVLSFRAATDRQPDADQETAWTKWFEQIGGSVAAWGHRVGQVRGLGTAKGSSGALAGYLVIEADDFSAAVSIAEGCPGLRYGGGGVPGTSGGRLDRPRDRRKPLRPEPPT